MVGNFRLIYVLLVCWYGLFCQQEPQYSLYQFNPTLINPAYSGFKEMASINLAVRNQWVGFDGAPRTLFFSANAPLLSQKAGAGLNVISDQAGARNLSILMATLCYNIKLSRNLYWGIGFSPNFQFFQFRYDKLSFKNTENSSLNLNYLQVSQFNAGFGTLLRTKTFFFGIGISNLSPNNVFNYYSDSSGYKIDIIQYRMRTHSYLTLGKSFMISEQLIFAPTILLRMMENNQLSNMDLNLNFFIDNTIWFGIIYRRPFGPGFLVQYYINQKFKIGYAFDTGTRRKVRLNSHEVCLTFDLYKNKSKIVSPRFL